MGVPPTRKPVFKSCEVAPALAEAMQTTAPTTKAMGWYASSVQPRPRKMREVAMSVAIVIPDTGLEEEPIKPTMREATVTKKNPNTMTNRAESRFIGILGRKAISTIRAALPTSTHTSGRSFSVRLCSTTCPLRLLRKSARESRNALTMVGSVLMSVMTPPKVTAPAPM